LGGHIICRGGGVVPLETMHSEKRVSVGREGIIALFTGVIYGGVHSVSGHPLNLVQTVVQVSPTKTTAMEVAKQVYKRSGIGGFFRGVLPPLWGAAIYRGMMLSGYESTYTYIDKHTPADSAFKKEVAGGLIRPIILASSLVGGTLRVVIESPIEYMKVMRQTRKNWVLRDCYRGWNWQLARTTSLLMPIFCIIDYCRRKTTLMNSLLGNFCVVGGASGASYALVFPLETLKSLAQTGVPHPSASLKERMHFLGGVKGLYRGMIPGCLAGAIRNGFGMIALVQAQKWATQLGLRD